MGGVTKNAPEEIRTPNLLIPSFAVDMFCYVP
jgi:hypothetical protein